MTLDIKQILAGLVTAGILSSLGFVFNNIDTLKTENAEQKAVINELVKDLEEAEDDIDTLETTIGDLKVVAGIIYGKDTTRAKWLGPREAYLFTRKGRVHHRYLKTGHIDSHKSSYRMDRVMTITALSVQLKEAETGATTLELRKNGVATVIGSLVITSAIGGQVTNLNIDLAVGDVLQMYVNGVEVEEVVAKVTVAYNGGAVV